MQQRDIKNWGGFTYSDKSRPTFEGQFWDAGIVEDPEDPGAWVADKHVIVFLDAPEQSEQALLPFIEVLRDEINEAYIQHRQGQKAVWITTHPINFLWD